MGIVTGDFDTGNCPLGQWPLHRMPLWVKSRHVQCKRARLGGAQRGLAVPVNLGGKIMMTLGNMRERIYRSLGAPSKWERG